jgi:hypothetical protein
MLSDDIRALYHMDLENEAYRLLTQSRRRSDDLAQNNKTQKKITGFN